MTLSVIIPTYNRPWTLLQALRSLREQTEPNFEVLVVDNAADHAIERIVAEFTRTAKVPISYIPEPRLGLHHARHAGARAACGDILVFTDDDATFDPGWLQAYARAFAKHPEMAAAGGPVRPSWESPPPQWLLDYMGDAKVFPILSLMEPYQEFRLDPKGFFFGVNMAIRRGVLFEVGGFNPDAFGDIWLGDGESGLNRKLWEREMLVGYVPEALVYHHIPSQRMTVEYLCHRMANEGACDMYARFHNGIPSLPHLLEHIAQIMAKNSVLVLRILASFLARRTSAPSLRIQMQAARAKSQLKYTVRLIRDRDFQNLVLKTDWLN